MMNVRFALLAFLLAPAMAGAQSAHTAACADPARVAEALARLEDHYGDVLSDISCDNPTVPAHVLLCNTGEGAAPQDLLWQMALLDTRAFVYAYENATGQEAAHETPPRDDGFIAIRDACTDEACLCDALKSHTNDALGGTSPYVD